MSPNKLTVPGLEQVYDALATAIDQAGPEKSDIFLVKLALLNASVLGDPRLFQQHIGVSPKRFILETRLRYARFLVENGTMSMTEIAFETGFSDSAHLATAFKLKYGHPPTMLR